MEDLRVVVKRALLTALVVVLLLVLALWGYFLMADKFSLSSMTSTLLSQDNTPLTPLSLDRLAGVNAILNQDYHYLSRGAQNFVFLSDDGHYVLKLVRSKRYKANKFEQLGLKILYSEKEAQKAVRKKEAFLTSCQLTDKELRDETGLVYMHIAHTKELHPTINIFDRLGKRYRINLDNTAFLVQHKGEKITTHVKSLLNKNDLEGFQNALQQLVNLLIGVSRKGIMDRDTNFNENVGYLEDRAIFIDVGEFYRNEKTSDPEFCLNCLTLQTFPFKKWIWKNFPDLPIQ